MLWVLGCYGNTSPSLCGQKPQTWALLPNVTETVTACEQMDDLLLTISLWDRLLGNNQTFTLTLKPNSKPPSFSNLSRETGWCVKRLLRHSISNSNKPKLMQKNLKLQQTGTKHQHNAWLRGTIKTITNHCGRHGHLPPSTVRGTACWAQCRGRVWTERPGLRSLYRLVWAPLWWDRDCWTNPESWPRTRRCHSWWRRNRKSEGEAEKFQKRQH